MVISAAQRPHGDTTLLSTFLAGQLNIDLVELRRHTIDVFDYRDNKSDDFLDLIAHLVLRYDTLIFTSPLYWYSTSTILKIFIDRLSNLLLFNKELGRLLRGKHFVLMLCGHDREISKSAVRPLEKTCQYLGMTFRGYCYVSSRKFVLKTKNRKKINAFFRDR